MKRSFVVACATLLTLVSALREASLQAQDSPDTVTRGTKRFDRRVVISGLSNPWEITLGPDGMLWVTERTGKRVTRVNPDTGAQKVALTIEEASAPGGQDGVIGLALDSSKHVYVSYTYQDRSKGPDLRVSDPASPYRHLYAKIVRYTYDAESGTLRQPHTILAGLPAGNDHNALRLKIGPDGKLYLTIGDQGNNQLGNFCHPVLSQRLPTKKEDYAAYEGKSLRINIDGSIPGDNPKLKGVVSHVFTYGHRNIQGIDFGPDGTLYAAEHGPKTDDEINILKSGGNYGWPNVAGLRDNKAYEFARWAEAKTPCSQLKFSDLAIHPSVPRQPETAFKQKMVEPIATLFTVPTGFNFEDPACAGINYICWPTVGISGVEYFGNGSAIPGWDQVLLITTLKRGSLYVLPLTADRQKAAGHMSRYFQTENRYRDTAVSKDGKTIYIATDSGGMGESLSGGATTKMADPGAILAYTYLGEGTSAPPPAPAREVTSTKQPGTSAPDPPRRARAANDTPPQFTARQVADGKKAYENYCAVCHGSTMTNGTFGTPLAGSYFKRNWHGKTAGAFLTKSSAMPPSAPASLPKDTYANIVAYILDFNGFKPGNSALPTGGEALNHMWIE
jgi:PQQ-dependent dehydrogenase (s-GDH family)